MSQEANEIKENRMGTAPVHSLLIKMSLPVMASMIVQALYNVVDSIFVSRVGEKALAAVSYCFPIQSLMIAFGIGTAVGMSALLSRFLGAKQFDRVNRIAQNGMFLEAMNFVLFFIIGLFSHQFLSIQTSDALTIQYGEQYMSIVTMLSFGVFAQILVERFLQASGKTFYIMFVQGIGAVINIIMDPILIFGLLGFPKLGVAGAAYATVLGQIIGAIIGIVINQRKNHEIPISLKNFRVSLTDIKDIYKIGLPSIVMQSIGSVMVFSFNKILSGFGALAITAVATFGAYFKLQSFIFMPVFGLNNGVVPIIAYNYGARRKDRMLAAMRIGARYGVTIMTVGMLIFWIFPKVLLSFFDASDQMLAIGTVTLRTISVGFPCAGYAIMRGASFQALGKSIYSMYISIARQLMVLIPAGFLLARLGNINLVWLAFPIAEVVGITMSILFTRKIKREIIEPIGAEM
ncbi:MAG: MATE family efflux transporter [Mogibacterium sp.]|nr:MATE family efflux transporter [Mogibacterium sp.]